MLSIKPIGSSDQQVSYYANLGKEDYYVSGGEAPGIWMGEGAAELELTGKVQGRQLRNVLRGFSVDGKTKLVQNAGQANRRSAFDLTWTVPKSVSVARSIADDTEQRLIDKCCDDAIKKTIGLFQELCGSTRRGHNGEVVQDAKLAMAVFRHETARGVPGKLPDPNLHWHVVVPNVAVRPDGSTGAFNAKKLFAKNMKMALGASFRAELAKQLSEAGLQSFRPKKKHRDELVSWFELRCVPAKLVGEFSKRRKEIEQWLSKHGLSGAKNAEKAALNTRKGKEDIRREELFKYWKEVGREFGFDPNLIRDEMSHGMQPDGQHTFSVLSLIHI